MLELRNLQIRHKNSDSLFAPLNLSIPAGQVAVVMGPSGVGKSTLLDAIGGHLAAGFQTKGDVLLQGRSLLPLTAQARRIGLIFQDPVLFPHLNVGQNLAFGLPRDIKGRSKRRATVHKALSDAGLADMGDRDPATLSGGQMARAALMRGLLARPQALLLDEPFSKLDTALRAEIREFTFAHIRQAGIPGLLVTHDPQDAEAAGGPMLTLSPA
ncbi:ATP-binding cassette domain-containing protein [Paracoccus sp. JM45]|uniref:ATP-binding cassette domain-containing protein n=1 Tax=Paracoccus sp. JM45 TaxID=2283626 RepID=UPI000E6B8B56|nr:ATP-binding cassette domain-containing protein [Paracoccus sp. JM45]RJE79209.1 ATP-binding cassette domain-containing protein [Paracoccus sp. JM45]